MDIEYHLLDLRFQLMLTVIYGNRNEAISDLMTKIGQEIDQLRKNGINIGF